MQLFELLGKIIIDSSGANKAIDDVTDKAEGSSKKMETSFGKVGGLMKGALLGGIGLVTTAIAGIGVAGIKGAQELENATDRMQAALGLTEADAKRLGQVSVEVFRNGFGASVTEAAGMVQTLRQQLGEMTDEQTSKLTQMAATISDVYGSDYAETIGTAKVLTEQFGISNEQAFDFITTGFQKGLNASGDFLQSIGEYSTQFSNGGATADQFFSVLETGMSNGVLGTDKAADAFKEFRLRIQDGSALTKDSLELIGISADDMAEKISTGQMTAADAFQLVIDKLGETEDPMIRMQAGAGLIGSQFEDLGDKAITELSLTSTALDDMAGATDRAGQAAYDNLGAKLTTLWRTLQTSATDALAPVIPLISDFVDVLIERVPLMIDAGKQVATYFQQWSPQLQGLFRDIQAVASDVFSILALLWTNVLRPSWSAMQPFVSGLFSALGDILHGFKLLLEGDITGAISSFASGAQELFQGFVNSTVRIISGIWGLVEQPLTNLKTNIVDKATEIKDGFVERFQELKRSLFERILDIPAYISTALEELRRSIVNKAIEVYNDFTGNFEDLKTELGNIVSGFWNGVKSHIETFATNIVEAIAGIPGRIGNIGQQIIDKIIEGLTGGKARRDVVNAAAATAGYIPEAVADELDTNSPSKVLYQLGMWATQGLAEGVADPGENRNLKSEAATVGENIITAVSDKLEGQGGNVIASFLRGLQDKLSGARETVTTIAGNVVGWFREAFGLDETENVFSKIGRLIADSLGLGISNPEALATLRERTASLAENTITAFMVAVGLEAPYNPWKAAGGEIVQGLIDGFNAKYPNLLARLEQMRADIQARTDTILSYLPAHGSEGPNTGTMPPTGAPQPAPTGGGSNLSTLLGPSLTWLSTNLTAFGDQLVVNTTALVNEFLARQRAIGTLSFDLSMIGTYFQNAINWISSTFQNGVGIVGTTLANAGNWVYGLLTGSASTWVSTINWVGSTLVNAGNFAFQTISSLGESLLNLAGSQIPWLGAVMDNMAGGPIAMLTAFLTSLIGETWQFQAVIGEAIKIVQPLIAILGDLISAIWPLIQVILNYLSSAFNALGWVLKTVITPVFTFVAKAIAAIWNALARAINWALGWLGVNVPLVNVNATAPASNGRGAGVSTPRMGQGAYNGAFGGVGSKGGARSSKQPTYKAPKQTAPKMPKQMAPKAPRASAPKTPGAPKSPTSPKSPGLSKTPIGSGSGTGAAENRGSGGTKVSEITGPMRDTFVDLLAPLATLPSILGVMQNLLAVTTGGLNVANPAVLAIGSGGMGGDVINHFNINMNATGNLKYDARQLAREITPHLATAFKNGKRGTGG